MNNIQMDVNDLINEYSKRIAELTKEIVFLNLQLNAIVKEKGSAQVEENNV